MPQYYFGTDANKIGEVFTDENSGKLVKVTLYPAAPNPDKVSSGSSGIVTEWVVTHPTQTAVVAFTSYGNKHPASMACFKATTSDTGISSLEKAFELSSGGRQAAHAMFHPNMEGEKLALAVAHHNDAMVTFFQLPKDSIPDALEDQPALTIELPELIPGTRHVLGTGTRGLSIPSCHQVYYAPNGKYLLCVDPNQSAVITYPVDDTGLPTQQEPSSTFTCHTDVPPLGWVSGAIGKAMRVGCRPRRVAVSPNGKFVFILYETRNTIQVYPLDNESGKIDPEKNGCMQEISTLEESLRSRKWIGMTMQACAEMIVYEDALYVSNRGTKVKMTGSASENSIKVFDIKDGGRLVVRQTVACEGPVRHFQVFGVPTETEGDDDDGNIVDGDAKDILLVAGTTKPASSLQTFRRHHGDSANEFGLVGNADVGNSVLCVAEGNS